MLCSYLKYQIFQHEKVPNSINSLVNFVQIWQKVISLVTMATNLDSKLLTIVFVFLSGTEHSVKVSSNSESVRAGALLEFFGGYRELMLRTINIKDLNKRILKHLHDTISHKGHYRYLVFGIHQNVIIKYKLSQKVLVYAHTMGTNCINEPAKRICMPVYDSTLGVGRHGGICLSAFKNFYCSLT